MSSYKLLFFSLPENMRIVVLGKTGAGKSSLLNTLSGENAFEINHTAKSGTRTCEAKSKTVVGKNLLLVDTPGFFDTDRSEEDMKAEIVNCITECAPGPHVFIIVLKVEKFTEQENQVIKKLTDYFSDEALRFATVLFTHGDQLGEETHIDQFVNESEELRNLVKRCGNRCNVLDNKYWKGSQDEYRSNSVQVKELLNTLYNIFEANNGGYYTTEMLQMANRNIDDERESLRQAFPNLSPAEVTQKAKSVVTENILLKVTGISAGALLGAFLGGGIKLMREGNPTVPIVLGIAFGTAVGIALGAETTGAGGTATSTVQTTGELQELGSSDNDAD
ncbi:GTPase IMAP family member 4-like [Poecilia formosa]|uniref:GTPase IMAP family member 4-like n=1 Tax=Poecilia formosa TaxID=48698 RepID=UPI0007B96DEF|nr:PREDICTED: GTPase IMAP family member 4-like [Poecilia formosa]